MILAGNWNINSVSSENHSWFATFFYGNEAGSLHVPVRCIGHDTGMEVEQQLLDVCEKLWMLL